MRAAAMLRRQQTYNTASPPVPDCQLSKCQVAGLTPEHGSLRKALRLLGSRALVRPGGSYSRAVQWAIAG